MSLAEVLTFSRRTWEGLCHYLMPAAAKVVAPMRVSEEECIALGERVRLSFTPTINHNESQLALTRQMENQKMSNPISGVTKGIMYIIHVLSHAGDIASQLSKLSGPTMAALKALFYDVMKVLVSAEGASAAAEGGDFLKAVVLSETTIGLLKTVAADFKAGEAEVVADFKTLEIAAK